MTIDIKKLSNDAGLQFRTLSDEYCNSVDLPLRTVCSINDVRLEQIECFAQLHRAAVIEELMQGVGDPHYWTQRKEDDTVNMVPFYYPEQLAGAVAKAKNAVIEELMQGVGEPVAWQLPGRVYLDTKEAEYDWRNDPVFDNTGYCPEPLYTAEQVAGAVAKAKQEAALERLTEYQQLIEQTAKLREALEGVMDRLVDRNETDEAAVFARQSLKETGQ